ncbi:Rha family transcriptional regulator [Paenibacillus dendritiformis]|uniref:Rha family transcriptional regulator n=1 Tax=Paenibacillus dendritiformis TaxID=130049 RepID=UPI0025E733C1|nr:Rha family transcriptional regulator [uncultured Paenibacillus sp.]MDU5143552.1 Rha family transcriptional regulator [Paenibacillus dendritiformis]
MSKLILNPDCGLYERKGRAYCSSRQVAEEFGREHRNILRSIDEITQPTSGVSEDFTELNFERSKYRDGSGKWNPEYLMTKDGFTILAMGFTGAKAMRFKEAYIRRFNQMESFIKSLQGAKLEHPAFTEAIMNAHEEPKHYHFSNEADMINRIVLGMNAKQFREANGIAKGESIRPYLNTTQIQAIEALQRVDIGLIVAMPDFQQRKEMLTGYYAKLQRRLSA